MTGLSVIVLVMVEMAPVQHDLLLARASSVCCAVAVTGLRIIVLGMISRCRGGRSRGLK